MSSPLLHLAQQGTVLRALGAVALKAARPKRAAALPSLPGPWIERTVAPRADTLVRDYVKHVGGDPSAYRGVVPAHMFPQWSFPLLAELIADLLYPTTKIVNAGCRIEFRAPLPAREPLHVKVRLESIETDERRALLTQKIVTGTPRVPEAVVAELRAIVPLGKANEAKSAKGKERPSVPLGAKEIGFFRLRATAGRDFAALTGDVNPIHWLRPAAKAAGFRGCILHGFSTLARTVETLSRRVFAGDVRALAAIDVRFTRPLVLPATVGVYLAGDEEVFVGDAPGGGAYLEGRYERRDASREVSRHG